MGKEQHLTEQRPEGRQQDNTKYFMHTDFFFTERWQQ
jgi:hypothetical protein